MVTIVECARPCFLFSRSGPRSRSSIAAPSASPSRLSPLSPIPPLSPVSPLPPSFCRARRHQSLVLCAWMGESSNPERMVRRRRNPSAPNVPPRPTSDPAYDDNYMTDDRPPQTQQGRSVGGGRGGPGTGGGNPRKKGSGGGNFKRALMAGVFVLGIGAGIWMDSALEIDGSNLASREGIDRQTPNPGICIANGQSAMVLDQRLFVSLNPFNVYVAQTEVKPGCVLRPSNWNVLESRGLVTKEEARQCKKNMNTFGYVGDVRLSPEVECLYHSEDAENLFLSDPSKSALGDGYQYRENLPQSQGKGSS
eukprot:jgi/Mesvir1/15715/Mv03295-RA.1